MSNNGKPFERKIAQWLKKENYYYQRFFDARSCGGFTAARPADYWVYNAPKLCFLELKSTIHTNIPYSHLTQLKTLKNVYDYNILSFFLMCFKTQIYAISAMILYDYVMANIEIKKSINELEASNIGIKLIKSADLALIL